MKTRVVGSIRLSRDCMREEKAELGNPVGALAVCEAWGDCSLPTG